MKEFKKVLVLYVGGTIGMKKNVEGVLSPMPNTFIEAIKSNTELHSSKLASNYFRTLKENEMILPMLGNEPHVLLYEIIEYSPLLDSSNMTSDDWIRVAKDIESYYHKYHGFVILHGTDTLAYTASALSFMLKGLQKPVVVTGAQIPIFETRSDARDNFMGSLIISGCCNIPEVCVFFANKLFRGNRTAKISSDELDAFYSPNYHTLADVGIDVKINDHFIRKTKEVVPFSVHKNLNPNVAVLAFFPTMTCQLVKAFLQPPCEGVVIQSYGAGNFPSDRTALLEVFKKAVNREIVIINTTQCARGAVGVSYEAGRVLEEIGIVNGGDMTVEAALTKLSYVLSLPGLTFNQKAELMRRDLRGEITNAVSSIYVNDFPF